MNKLETKEAVEILLSEKKKTGYKLAKAYDSYCLLPNEHDQEDWDNYSALVTALEMAVEALEKQIPKKPEKVIDKYCENLYTAYCPVCHWMLARGNYRTGYVDKIHKNCPECLQAIDWTEGE